MFTVAIVPAERPPGQGSVAAIHWMRLALFAVFLAVFFRPLNAPHPCMFLPHTGGYLTRGVVIARLHGAPCPRPLMQLVAKPRGAGAQ